MNNLLLVDVSQNNVLCWQLLRLAREKPGFCLADQEHGALKGRCTDKNHAHTRKTRFLNGWLSSYLCCLTKAPYRLSTRYHASYQSGYKLATACAILTVRVQSLL